MKGLLEQEPEQTPGAPLPAPPTAAEDGKGILGAAVNQQELDIFIANGLKLVHDAKISDVLINSIVKAKNPVQAVATATLDVVERLEQSASAAGKKMSLPTLAHGANFIMGEIIATAEAAGLEAMDDRTKYQAFSLAVGKYLDNAVKSGKITKEQVAQLGQEAGATPEGQKIMNYSGDQPMAPLAGAAPAVAVAGGQNGERIA